MTHATLAYDFFSYAAYFDNQHWCVYPHAKAMLRTVMYRIIEETANAPSPKIDGHDWFTARWRFISARRLEHVWDAIEEARKDSKMPLSHRVQLLQWFEHDVFAKVNIEFTADAEAELTGATIDGKPEQWHALLYVIRQWIKRTPAMPPSKSVESVPVVPAVAPTCPTCGTC